MEVKKAFCSTSADFTMQIAIFLPSYKNGNINASIYCCKQQQQSNTYLRFDNFWVSH